MISGKAFRSRQCVVGGWASGLRRLQRAIPCGPPQFGKRLHGLSRIKARRFTLAFFLPAGHRSGVTVVAWASSFSNPSVWSGATAAGSPLSTGLGCCPVARSMIDLASWLGSWGRLCWSVIGVARKR